MAVVFRCPRYPGLRVGRGDGTYITFLDGVAYATTERDVNLLRACDHVTETTETKGKAINAAMLKPPLLSDGIVNWFSPIYGTADGYGSSAEQMILALERAGIDVRVIPGSGMSSQETHISDVTRKPLVRGSCRVLYSPPHLTTWSNRFDGQALLGFSMWEDSALPHAWNEALQTVDAIAAPSKFCADMFEARIKELGADIPVSIVPLGVRADMYPYSRREFSKGNESFVVFHSCTAMQEERKGARAAYEAFKLAFEGHDDVKMIFRARHGRIDVGGDPRVEFRTGIVSDAQKYAIMQEAHVLLYTSRGEGFGLIPLECIASGMPAIVADNTAMSDYRDLFIPITCTPAPSQLSTPFQERSTGEWYEASVEEAASHLRDVYENYQKASADAAKAAKVVRKRWSYDATAVALQEAIEVAKCSYSRRHPTSP